MNKILIIILLIILNGCGFKVLKNEEFSKYYISQVNTIGDKKINYRLKNKIIPSKASDKIPIIIDLETTKEKTIKEKNIENEITKYNLKINVKAKVKLFNSSELKDFKVTKIGSYSVENRYTDTRNNEKKLIKNLANDIADDIKKQLSLILK